MKNSSFTIYDLAKLTGVSYATVSRVLNGNGRTSVKTRQLVMEVAEEHNFRPKMKARKTTVAILVDVHDCSMNRYVPSVLASLVEGLSCHDVAIEIFTRSNVSHFRNCLVDAVVALPWNESVDQMLVELRSIPKVLINYSQLEGCLNVSSDHEQSGVLAASYLHSKGHHVSGIILSSQDKCNKERAKGFCKFYNEHGIEMNSRLCAYVSDGTSLMALEQVLSCSPTAIFLGLDDHIELWSILKSKNMRIPEDISLITMENDLYSRFLCPAVTSINQNLSKVVGRAVDLVVRLIQKQDSVGELVVVENNLVERESVRHI